MWSGGGPPRRAEGNAAACRESSESLRLELNCESEGAESYRHNQRDGNKGEPHVMPRTQSTVPHGYRVGGSIIISGPSRRSALPTARLLR
jgi:hypothetical protein